MNPFLLIFVIHILINLIIFILRLFHVIKCEYITILISALIPVWGLFMLVEKSASDRRSYRQGVLLELERPRANVEQKSVIIEEDGEVVPISEAVLVNDNNTSREMMMDILMDVNKSIVIDDDEMKEKVVPLEEALVVNDTATRRALIIDVLYKNPGDYVAQLNEAKSNGDTEVVHYAATALTEIQKEFDQHFQDLAERKAKNPEDERIEAEYLMLLESYVSSGLLSGEGLKNQLVKLSELMGERIKKNGNRGRWTLLNKKANIDLKLKNLDALEQDIALLMERWPERDGVYALRIHHAILKKDGEEIQKILREIEEKNMYLSAELKSIVGFWDKKVGANV